ncbi:MAG: BREX system ATP-binding domain-containing protein [Promethearchaeota archaeon]
MYSELSDDDKAMYLDVLREAPILPFSNFVSRGDLPDKIDVARPRAYIDREVYRLVQQTYRDRSSRLIPVLGSAGSGKTHAYHSFKDKERENKKKLEQSQEDQEIEVGVIPVDWTIVYVPSPPASIRVLLHVYTCMIEELGAGLLDIVSEKLVRKWGGDKKGIFQKPKIDEVIQIGIREFPGVFADCVKALVTYQLDKSKKALAERWLLGEDLEDEELTELGINSVVEEDDLCLALIKIVTENLYKVLILYFDELESPYRMLGEAAERKFLEILKRLYNEVKGLVITIAVLKEIWPRIIEIADAPLRSRMEPEQELKPFSLNDLKIFFSRSMETFWEDNNLNPPLYPLFPLNEKLIEMIYEKTQGNPRNSIKLCRRFIDKIVMEEMTVDELLEVGADIVATAKPPSEIEEEVVDFSKPREVIKKTIEDILAEEEYSIDVNPQSVAGATLKCINMVGDDKGKKYKTQMEFKFKMGKRSQTLAALIEAEGKKWGLEIPSIKTFDRSAGVAGYYAAKRLKDAITEKVIDYGILIVPTGTGGAKYEMILKNNPEIHKVELNNEIGEDLIQNALKYPTQKGWDIAKIIFQDIGEYVPPISEEPSIDEEPSK